MWCSTRINTWTSFISDIYQPYESSCQCKLILFANDSALLAFSSDVSEIEDVLSREVVKQQDKGQYTGMVIQNTYKKHLIL